MKYVMMEVSVTGGDAAGTIIHVPIIFPDALIHKDVAAAMRGILIRQFRYSVVTPVSAGKYDVYTQTCSGESETLGLKSDPEDSRTIQTYRYCHGIQQAG